MNRIAALRIPLVSIQSALATLFVLSQASPALAAPYVVGDPAECCGANFYVDCQARPQGDEVCRAGHVFDHNEEDTDFFHWLRCIGVGCLQEPSPPQCRPDVAEGETSLCVTNVRSCADQVGSVTCRRFFPSECSSPITADPMLCPMPACQGGAIDMTDTDGDALPDCWESAGIDYDGDGVIDLDLPALGANPEHKDIFVEVDAFDCSAGGDCAMSDAHSHVPMPGAIQDVVDAFANATTVGNPDGSTGIHLVVQVDETLPHQQVCPFDGSCFGAVRQSHFGTASERGSAEAAKILAAKRVAFRYSLWGHNLAAGDSTSGIAEAPGNDFMVTLGEWTSQVGTRRAQAGTLMHELGHNLSLQHGGADAVNRKPNYLSVMNYEFQTESPVRYSTATLPTLDEANLNESAGISDGSQRTFYYCPNGSRALGIGNAAIDWNCRNPATEIGVSVDLNRDGACVGAASTGPVVSSPAVDDAVMGGRIEPGADAALSTVPAGDDVAISVRIFPGPDGVLQTVPATGSDDFILGQEIVGGPNRTCDTAAQPGDVQLLAVGTREPMLTGYDDWSNLRYDFVGTSGFGDSLTSFPQEIDVRTWQQIEDEQSVADLGIHAAVHLNADNTVVYTITVLNQGSDLAVSPTINAAIPGFETVLSCTATGSGTCAGTPSYQVIAFDTIPSGASEFAEITVRMNATPPVNSRNVFQIAATSLDPNRADNATSVCVAPPVITSAPADLVVKQCAAPKIGVPSVIGLCGTPTITNDAPAVFPLGKTIVTWTARDAGGNFTTATQTVTAELGDDPSCCPQGTNVILGTSRDDRLTGTSGSDCILGRAGNDKIEGRGGDDYLSGGADHDTLQDDAGNNYMTGAAGDDTLVDGPGSSLLIGGFGRDQLSSGLGTDRLFGSEDNDTLQSKGPNALLDGGGGSDVCIDSGPNATVTACEIRRH